MPFPAPLLTVYSSARKEIIHGVIIRISSQGLGREHHNLTFFFVVARLNCDVISWKHFSRYWPFVRGIHRWPVNSPHKGQWRGALIFTLICAWIDSWVHNRKAGDRTHYDVTVIADVTYVQQSFETVPHTESVLELNWRELFIIMRLPCGPVHCSYIISFA